MKTHQQFQLTRTFCFPKILLVSKIGNIVETFARLADSCLLTAHVGILTENKRRTFSGLFTKNRRYEATFPATAGDAKNRECIDVVFSLFYFWVLTYFSYLIIYFEFDRAKINHLLDK